MNKKIVSGLIAALMFQFAVLTGMVVSAALPLWTGREIKVKTVPVDPRSLFRGDYARLGYEFSRLDKQQAAPLQTLRDSEIVYVRLKEGLNGVYGLDKILLQKPDTGVFLRGRLQNRYGSIQIRCGIEAYFAPGQKVLKLEKELRDGGIAVLMVSENGKARIKDVVGK